MREFVVSNGKETVWFVVMAEWLISVLGMVSVFDTGNLLFLEVIERIFLLNQCFWLDNDCCI